MSAVAVFILFVICLVIAIPVSISLGIVAVLPGAFDPSFTASASYVIRSMLGGIDSFPLLAVPMFVLAGILMAHGKISQKLFDVFVYLIGKRTAGIPCAVIITCLFYGAISGSAPATVAAVGSMTIPLLIELGYKKILQLRSLQLQEAGRYHSSEYTVHHVCNGNRGVCERPFSGRCHTGSDDRRTADVLCLLSLQTLWRGQRED